MDGTGGITIRERRDGDLATCGRLVALTHLQDGYPIHLAGPARAFLCPPDALGAWVAADQDGVVGHVALRRRSSPAAMALAQHVLELPAERLAVVVRLLVAPHARRRGIARALLASAAGAARSSALQPILDVDLGQSGAVHLYEAAGWLRLGTFTVTLPDGRVVPEALFALEP